MILDSFSIYNDILFITEQDVVVTDITECLNDLHDVFEMLHRQRSFQEVMQEHGNTETLVTLSNETSMFNVIGTGVRKVVQWIIQKFKELYDLICRYLKVLYRRFFKRMNLTTGETDLEHILRSIPDKQVLVPYHLNKIIDALWKVYDCYKDFVVTSAHDARTKYLKAELSLSSSLKEVDPSVTTLKQLYEVLFNVSSMNNIMIDQLEITSAILGKFLARVSEDNTPEELIQIYNEIRNGYRNLPNIVKWDNTSHNPSYIVDVLNEYIKFTKETSELLTPFINKITQLYHGGGIQVHLRYPVDPDLVDTINRLYDMPVTISQLIITSQSVESWTRIGGHNIDNPITAWCYTDTSVYVVNIYINIHKFLSLENTWFKMKKVVGIDDIETYFLYNIVHEGCHLGDSQHHVKFDNRDKEHDERTHEQTAIDMGIEYVSHHMTQQHRRWIRSIINSVKKEVKRSLK